MRVGGGHGDATRVFDVEERLQRLSDIGDQREAYAAVVDFEIFRADLEAALGYSDGAKGGWPPYDPVLTFRSWVAFPGVLILAGFPRQPRERLGLETN